MKKKNSFLCCSSASTKSNFCFNCHSDTWNFFDGNYSVIWHLVFFKDTLEFKETKETDETKETKETYETDKTSETKETNETKEINKCRGQRDGKVLVTPFPVKGREGIPISAELF